MSLLIRLSEGEELSPADLKKVAEAAASGRIVAFPTDTVYGLGSSALDPEAALKIYRLKGRSALKPLPLLVHSVEAAKRWARWSPPAEVLSRRFWPGPVTLILRATSEARRLAGAGQTVALRVPGHPLLLKLIAASGVPWAATSANLSGAPALSRGEDVARLFDGKADAVIDAGEVCGIESTVVDAAQIPVRVLREGAVSAADLLEALGQAVR